jgi:hypothetical protein
MVLRELLFGPHDAYRLRVIGGERESLRVPELELILFAIVLLRAAAIGGAAGKQPHGGLIQLALVLLQADDQIPSDAIGQLEHRRLGVQSIEQEDVKKPAAVESGELAEQAQSGRVFALTGLKPFDGQKRLAGAADNLASDRAVVITVLFPPAAAHPQAAITQVIRWIKLLRNIFSRLLVLRLT